MRVYHFVNREHGLDDLRQRRLKVATIADLNDPFELLCTDLSNAGTRKVIHAWKDEIGRRFGMLCFSKGWQNPVQWSHYANRHRGLCLAFDINDDAITPVSYQRNRSSVDSLGLRKTDERAILRYLSTKYHHWRYEQEVRAYVRLENVDLTSGLYFTSFSEKLRLVGVIAGAMSNVSREELGLALGPELRLAQTFKGRLAFRSFRVVRQLDDSQWQ